LKTAEVDSKGLSINPIILEEMWAYHKCTVRKWCVSLIYWVGDSEVQFLCIVIMLIIEETFTFVNTANDVGCDAVHIRYQGTRACTHTHTHTHTQIESREEIKLIMEI
jgi:hypothetical protein